jgi:NAD-dependent SIR2 family protein deacetylase
MQVVKKVFLIGNGFNNLIAEIIRNHDGVDVPENVFETKESCVSNVLYLTTLWQKFDEAFAELKDEIKGVNEEELIGLIQCVINFLSCLDGLDKNIDINEIQKLLGALLDKFLVKKIVDIANDFRQHENIAEYKHIKHYFKSMPYEIEEYVRRNPASKFNLYTTNYDGILETVFAKRQTEDADGILRTGFIHSDGFSTVVSPSLRLLNKTHLEDAKMKFLHLHGSYKFVKNFGVTCKLVGTAANPSPVMVFNRPTLKGQIVGGDNVLNTYFEKLRRDLSTCDRFIILGNSMKTEPHIMDLIKNSIKPEATIVICSRNPAEVKARIRPHVRCNIDEVSTLDITTESQLTGFLISLIA